MSKILTIHEKVRLIYDQVKSSITKLDSYCWFRDKSEISVSDEVHCSFTLPQAYLDLYFEFDGFCISWCDFLSSTSLLISSVDEYKEALTNWEYAAGYYPFAKNAGGDIFTFSPHDQKIWIFDIGCFDEPPKLIAESFDEFMNDCVLGNRYLEFSFKEDNDFYKFLVKQGWVQE
jgi:hypothetical protein